MKFDKEERKIIKALENGKIKLKTPLKKEIEAIKNAAEIPLKKTEELLYVFMTMITQAYKRKHWKWEYLIKP